MAHSRIVRIFTFLWVLTFRPVFIASLHAQKGSWDGGTFEDALVWTLLMLLIAYSVVKLRSNIALVVNWVLLALGTWDMVFNFPANFLPS